MPIQPAQPRHSPRSRVRNPSSSKSVGPPDSVFRPYLGRESPERLGSKNLPPRTHPIPTTSSDNLPKTPTLYPPSPRGGDTAVRSWYSGNTPKTPNDTATRTRSNSVVSEKGTTAPPPHNMDTTSQTTSKLQDQSPPRRWESDYEDQDIVDHSPARELSPMSRWAKSPKTQLPPRRFPGSAISRPGCIICGPRLRRLRTRRGWLAPGRSHRG